MIPKKLTIEKIQEVLRKQQYICDRSLATVVFLSIHLGKPVLLEGEAGVGKTEVAKVLAEVMESRLIRLQCYEGLDANTALYEWNYPKQMLRIKLEEVGEGNRKNLETEIFTEEYLVKRPLLDAIQSDGSTPPVLLIDEIDRADMEFEAFLLEVLSDFQITIPEIGTIRAKPSTYLLTPLQSAIVLLPCPIPPPTDLVYRGFKFIDSPERLNKKSYAPFNIPQMDPFRCDHFSALVMIIS